MARVLGMPELFKDILINLDIKTLLLSQRVCKAFRSTITKSTRLQQALFLKPISAAAFGNGTPISNPLLQNRKITVDVYGAHLVVEFCKDDIAEGDMVCSDFYATEWYDGHNSSDLVKGGWQKMLLFRPAGACPIRLASHQMWHWVDDEDVEWLDEESYLTLGAVARKVTS
ncbi:hypothetical protein LTR85_009779 [Meristemomyces frigidus]|nr:hypothetical protein LTR85_009779 [Meristemomyces frigidus]